MNGDPGQARQRILVVDDDDAARDALATALRDHPNAYDVATASDVEGAHDLIGRFRPDLIILDLLSPARAGLEVCRRVRLDADREATKIIIFTAHPEPDHREQALLCDADLFLCKPQPLDVLEAHIEELLER